MAKLRVLGSHLQALKPGLGSMQPKQRSIDAQRVLYAPWRKWYNTARWKKLRILIFVRDHFCCQWPGCGHRTSDTSKLVADHRKPHRGDDKLFWDQGNIWTLCKPCHDRLKQREERALGSA